MHTNPPETGTDPLTSLGIFMLIFWPASLLVALGDALFFQGDAPFPVTLGIASAVGVAGAWKHEANLRRRNGAA